MIYSKLPIVFLSTIASEKNGSTNSIIATYILNHLNELQNIGIKELATRCHVAVSSISRFCKEIGLRDFMELRELLLSPDLEYEHLSDSNKINQRVREYSHQINKSIELAQETLSLNQLTLLCKDIKDYQNIAAFGLLKAGAVALNLQTDLLMLGKQIYTNISYHEQINYILNATKKDLIIIFSYTGSYFDYQDLRALKNQLSLPNIWLITGQKKDYPSYINHTLTFESLQDQGSHPYQLQFIESLIAQEYANINGK